MEYTELANRNTRRWGRYRIALVTQQCGQLFVQFLWSRIALFWNFIITGRSLGYLNCRVVYVCLDLVESLKLALMPKHVEVDNTNCILWYVFYTVHMSVNILNSLPCPQQPAVSPYPEPDESNPFHQQTNVNLKHSWFKNPKNRTAIQETSRLRNRKLCKYIYESPSPYLLLSTYSYCCLCILIVHLCILIVVYVFLLLSMYSYCSPMYSYRCLCILIVVYVFLLLVHVFLTLSVYSYCCQCILIVVYVYLLLSMYS